MSHRVRSPRLTRRFLPLALAASVFLPIVAAAPSNAALGTSERALLATVLEGAFYRPPTRTTLNCVSGRLPSGTINEMVLDAALVEDSSELADSLAFRKVFRAMFACKPAEVVPLLAAELRGSGLTSRQRTCFARNLMGRFVLDDAFLTIAIRGGLQDLSFENEDSIVTRNAIIALAGCVPGAAIDEIIAQAILAATVG
jgi:hypothetical protein